MKKIFKFLLIISFMLFTLTPSVIPAANTYADDQTTSSSQGCRYFLGMVSWDCNVDIKHKDSTTNADSSKNWLTTNIWTIAANVLTDISIIAVYLVIGYVIYGGYLYMFSSGDPGKVAAGKKTLTQAFIGLAIVMLSSVILNAIRIALGANFATNCVEAGNCYKADDVGNMVTSAIQWVIGVSGVVAAIFVVVGGAGYIMSSGDPGKLQKAKNTIIYALIGLAVVALAEVITATVSSIIRDANDANKTSSTNQITIAKELYVKNH